MPMNPLAGRDTTLLSWPCSQRSNKLPLGREDAELNTCLTGWRTHGICPKVLPTTIPDALSVAHLKHNNTLMSRVATYLW